MKAHPNPGELGFSLIEMVIVVVLTGILASVLVTVLTGPLKASADTERRARLVDLAETALGRMTRELRLALPNSIRVATSGSRIGVEMLRTLDGGRYRAEPATGPPPNCGAAPNGDPLEFTCVDTVFDVLGQLPRIAQMNTGAAGDCLTTPATADCVVVFNTGPPGGNDAYTGVNAFTIGATGDNAAADGSDQLTLATATAYPLQSPSQRFHVVDTPVSFVCDTAAGTITRYEGYPIADPQVVPPGGSSALLVNTVGGCAFTYNAGSAKRGGLVTLRLTVTEPSSGESVTLLQQAHVSNQP